MGFLGRNRIMVFTLVASTTEGDGGKVLVRRDLVEQVWQHRRIAKSAAHHLNGAYLQRFLIDSNIYLAPEAALGPAVLACVPLTFAPHFDARAVRCLAVVCLQTMRGDQ